MLTHPPTTPPFWRSFNTNISSREEIFGPVQVIVEVETLDEAIALVNRNQWGNGGAIFTQSGAAAHAFVNGSNIGQVGVNVPVPVPLPVLSFTGNKKSFLGQHNCAFSSASA